MLRRMSEERSSSSPAIEPLTVSTPAGPFDALAAGPSDGRAVLLLHGFPESARQWEAQLETLAGAGMRAVAFDQRGYSPGVRPAGVEAYRIDHLVDDVLAVASALDWETFDLVGHDWGAAVAWAVAAAAPARLHTLTAVSVPCGPAFAAALRNDPDQRRRSAYFALFQRPGEAERQLLSGELDAFFTGMPPGRSQYYKRRMSDEAALTAALNWYRAMSPPARRGPITVPTMYVWSTEDAFIGETAARGVADLVEGPYRFEVLEGVSHWISEEAPERLDALLLEHLAAW